MERLISKLLAEYEHGAIGRRQLIQALATVATAATTSPATGSTFQGIGINHIAIRVTNVQRSRDFYQKHLGAPVIHEAESNCFLGLGNNFLTLFKNEQPGLDHYCVAIDNFKADRVMTQLDRQGLKPRRPSDSDRVYFRDPDGLEVQLSAIDHHA